MTEDSEAVWQIMTSASTGVLADDRTHRLASVCVMECIDSFAHVARRANMYTT